MAKSLNSLKSVLSKIKLVDVVVVLVFVAGMMCLMKKMDVVEGMNGPNCEDWCLTEGWNPRGGGISMCEHPSCNHCPGCTPH